MAREDVRLEPDIEHFLFDLVEAYRRTDAARRQSFRAAYSSDTKLFHPGLPGGKLCYEGSAALRSYVSALRGEGMINLSKDEEQFKFFDLTRKAFTYYTNVKQQAEQPLAEVETDIERYLDGPAFGVRHPEAYQRWRQAAQVLSDEPSSSSWTDIGHRCREAMQEFCADLVREFKPTGINVSDTAKSEVTTRVRAVLKMKPGIGERERTVLAALITYWSATYDFAQRQEHGAQKDDVPLTWENGRRLVFLTAVAMFEIDQCLTLA